MPSVLTERQRETEVLSGAWLARKPWTRDRSPPELQTQNPPFSPCAWEGGHPKAQSQGSLTRGAGALGVHLEEE